MTSFASNVTLIMPLIIHDAVRCMTSNPVSWRNMIGTAPG